MKSKHQNLKQISTHYCVYTTKSCSVHTINCGDTNRYKQAKKATEYLMIDLK